jgi:hypothetical protein
MAFENLSLATLGGGAAVEKFDEEFRRLAENVLDPNTEATDKREITLKVTVKPTKERRDGELTIKVASKLAAPIAVQTRAFFAQDRQSGEFIAGEHNPQQMALAFERSQRGGQPALVANQHDDEENGDDR